MKIAQTIVPKHAKVAVQELARIGVLAIAQHIVIKNALTIV